MPLYTLGINHTTAPVGVRERVVFPSDQIEKALQGLIHVIGVTEAAILSTCNRTELYCNLQSLGHDDQILRWLGDYHRLDRIDLQPFLYRYLDRSAVRHALRVACGLDSMILGEPQILGQLKSAYQDADHAGTLGRELSRLFQHAFSAAKQVRTDTSIGANPVSVAFAAVNLAKQIFENLSEQSALLIGAGETIELVARHLAGGKIGHIVVANRSVERAKALAEQFQGKGIGLTQIGDTLPDSDIVVSSTASPLPILGKGLVERAIKQRRHRPMFMVDIAVPRDIEPEVGELDDLYLYTVDDLDEVVHENLESRREAAVEADKLIQSQVEDFMAWLRLQDAVGTIRHYRGLSERLSQQALAKAKQMAKQGKPTEQVLEYLAYTLTNKLTDGPTRALNQAGREGRRDLLEAATILLNLDEREN
ncbi:MAG: glutamyl-tRNA reductase [Pseudomonadota bacterium]